MDKRICARNYHCKCEGSDRVLITLLFMGIRLTVATSNLQVVSIGHLIGNDDAEKSVSRYTLFNTRTSGAVRDEQTLVDAGVKDGDELLLIPKRNVPQSGSSSGVPTARHSQALAGKPCFDNTRSSLSR